MSEGKNAKLIAEAVTLYNHSRVSVPEHAAMIFVLATAIESADARNAEQWDETNLLAELAVVEAERDAALAVIEQVRAQFEACRAMVDENLVTPDVTAAVGLVVRGLDPILATAPADALAEHDRVIAEKAWDAGADVVELEVDTYGKTAERLMEEGDHTSANRYFSYAAARRTVAMKLRRTNPYRANPEPKEGEHG